MKSEPTPSISPAPVSAPAPAPTPALVPVHWSFLMLCQDQMIISIVNHGFNTARWSDISLCQNLLLLLLLFLLLLLLLFLLVAPCSLHMSCQDQMIISIIHRGFNTARWNDISLSQNLLLLLLLLLLMLLLLLLFQCQPNQTYCIAGKALLT